MAETLAQESGDNKAILGDRHERTRLQMQAREGSTLSPPLAQDLDELFDLGTLFHGIATPDRLSCVTTSMQ